jgi:hypothetical protein
MLASDVDLRALSRMKTFGAAVSRLPEVTAVKQCRVSRQQLNRGHLDMIAFANRLAGFAIGLFGNVISYSAIASGLTRPQQSGNFISG